MSNSSIWPIDRTLPGAITPSQSGPESNGNEGVLRIHESSSTVGGSTTDCLLSYAGQSWGRGSYPCAEMQSVYFTAPADWTINQLINQSNRYCKFASEWTLKWWQWRMAQSAGGLGNAEYSFIANTPWSTYLIGSFLWVK